MRPDVGTILAPPTPALLEVIKLVASLGVETEPTVAYLSNRTRLDVAHIVKHAPRVGDSNPGQVSYGALHVQHSGLISDQTTVGLAFTSRYSAHLSG